MSKCGTPCNTCETVKKRVKKNSLFPVPSHLRLEPKRSVHLSKRETFSASRQARPIETHVAELPSTLTRHAVQQHVHTADTNTKAFGAPCNHAWNNQERNQRGPSPASSQVPDPSPGSKQNQRKYASNRQAHQSTPLLENCVALIRHVIQQLVHVRTVVADVQLKTVLNHEGRPKTHLHSGKSVKAPSSGRLHWRPLWHG